MVVQGWADKSDGWSQEAYYAYKTFEGGGQQLHQAGQGSSMAPLNPIMLCFISINTVMSACKT